ncbi:Pentraxin fusion protein [Holothuria leucospilota]|uniref:Pentraxin fusion protein n=1 Tax=Holothuria leucospilota TaxID=206669 RepID=A0A9Q1C2Z6_HOLLE|nr:Pentraxin fusion protein [Holothuria leucospilota]
MVISLDKMAVSLPKTLAMMNGDVSHVRMVTLSLGTCGRVVEMDNGQRIPIVKKRERRLFLDECLAVVNNGEYERILYFGQPSDAQSFPSNTVLEVDCAEGRMLEGPAVSFCRRGVWDPPRLLCVQTAPCQEVPAEVGRTIVYTDNTGNQKQHQSNLTVNCTGRMLRFGQSRSTCVNGAWSPPVAHCKENLALRKDAYQVSTDYGGHASRAVDGITNGRYDSGSCTHTSRLGHNKWWYVNLGSRVLVQDIVIYNRQDNDHHTRLLNAKVRVGDHTSDVTLNQLAASVTDTAINPIHIQLNPAIEGSIVSVSETDHGNPLILCEVQVFGELRDGFGLGPGEIVPHKALQGGTHPITHRRTTSAKLEWFNVITHQPIQMHSTMGCFPFIHGSSTEFSTLYAVMKIIQGMMTSLGQKYTVITFDLAICIKAKRIQTRQPGEFANTVIRMRGFHIK